MPVEFTKPEPPPRKLSPDEVYQRWLLRFPEQLARILDETGDVAAEATWQQNAKLIAQSASFLASQQSPLSTVKSLETCANVVLKIRLATKKGGVDPGESLAEFEALMAEVFAGEAPEEDGSHGGADDED